jgi:hypothetical protein
MKSIKLLAIALLLTLANTPTEAQRLKSSSGSTIGYVDDGRVKSSSGSIIGYFEGVRRIEAVLYFFFFFY